MKTFKEILLESEKEHKMTLRFAGALAEGDEDRIEKFLGKYDVKNMSKTSTTPISNNE